jgi:hypothetical protein
MENKGKTQIVVKSTRITLGSVLGQITPNAETSLTLKSAEHIAPDKKTILSIPESYGTSSFRISNISWSAAY